MADIWVPLRAGSDIVFLGGLIRYVARARARTSASTSSHYTNASRDPARGLPRHRGSRRPVLGLGRRQTHGATTPTIAGSTQRDDARPADERDPTLQHPRCVYPGPAPPLRALHAGDGGAGLRHPARAVPARSPRRSAARSGPGEDRRDLLRASAGRSTRRACRSSAPRRSCSCCSATSAGPAAASWRCAATPRSRARPTSRRSTTSCPATCRCRASRASRRRWPTTSTQHRPQTGWWHNIDKYIVSLLKAWYGDARDARRTTSASAGCRASPATTRTWLLARHGRRQASKGCS